MPARAPRTVRPALPLLSSTTWLPAASVPVSLYEPAVSALNALPSGETAMPIIIFMTEELAESVCR